MRLAVLLGVAGLASCANELGPPVWQGITFPSAGFDSVEGTSNKHGIYLVYDGRDYQGLFIEIERSLVEAGFSKVGEALDGAVIGFKNENVELAMKQDQFGSKFYVAVFDEKGKEPLLHQLAFGRAELGEELSGEELKAQLLKDFGE